MLNEERRTMEESYTSATQSSNLRCEADRRTDVDVLIAAGLAPGVLGAALMRLHGEWDGAERKRLASAADFLGAARNRPADTRKPPQTSAQVLAVAHEMAQKHNAQQAKLFMGTLKTLPHVVDALAKWAAIRALPEPQALAHAVVAFWLDGTCHVCHGRGKEVIPGTPALGKPCKACRGTGRRKEPEGEAGRLMLTLVDDCVVRARNSMRKRLHPSANV